MITIDIGCVDGSALSASTEDLTFAEQFLKQNDHEGSSITLTEVFHGASAYQRLQALREKHDATPEQPK